MEIKGEDYQVHYNDEKNAIEFTGTMRLRDSAEYQDLSDMLQSVYDNASAELVLDFRNLQFLNSSGINTISKFIINARKSEKVPVKIMGSNEVSWQQKSLKNLQKLWSSVQIQID